MRDKYKNKKQFQKKSRLEILKSWMTSFVITASAVIVAVVVIPASPKAKIKNIQVFQDQVVYQVEITDNDNAIRAGTLEIILENQLERYTIPLDLGMNVGYFSELNDDTTYQMYVMGDKGFGNEKLASQTITTELNSGGAILSYNLLESSDIYNPQYEVDLLVSDNLDKYTNVVLYYGVVGYEETEPFEYYSFVISDGQSSVVFDEIYQSNAQVYTYLEATLANNDTIILDELTFYTPLNFEIYYYRDQVSDTTIKLSMYPESYLFDKLTYEFKLIKDGLPVETQRISINNDVEETMHMNLEIVFEHLKKGTLYVLEVKAIYKNPQTLAEETKIAEPTEIRTLEAFSYTIDISEFETYYEVTLNVVDPKHNFQLAYYHIYDIQGEFDIYISSAQLEFTPIDEFKTVTFIIDKPDQIPIRIDIGLQNEANSIYHQIIHQILILE